MAVRTCQNQLIRTQSLVKRYGDVVALDGVSLAVQQGEFLALLGPSGCGKTTLLRLIAGFIEPTSGELSIADQSMTGVAPNRRPVNTVFQNYALFPHLTVAENIAFGPRRRRVAKSEVRSGVAETLALVGMDEFVNRYPSELSGGQQQRVALARAIINKPKVLLLDEPLGALDLKLRKRMQIELKHLQARLGITFIFVTHDQEEALVMADRIAVMSQGRIMQTRLRRGDLSKSEFPLRRLIHRRCEPTGNGRDRVWFARRAHDQAGGHCDRSCAVGGVYRHRGHAARTHLSRQCSADTCGFGERRRDRVAGAELDARASAGPGAVHRDSLAS